MNLVIKHKGLPIIILTGETLDSLPAHIRNGFPDLREDLEDSHITGEEMDDVSGVTLSPYPITEKVIREKLLRIFLEDRFDLENRIRTLEALPQITRQQFIDAVKTRLGL